MLSMNQQNHRQNSLKEAWLILVLSIPAPNNSGEVFFFFLTKNHWKNILENLALLIKHACLTLFPPAFSSKSSRSSFSERLSDIVCLKMLLFCLFFFFFLKKAVLLGNNLRLMVVFLQYFKDIFPTVLSIL